MYNNSRYANKIIAGYFNGDTILTLYDKDGTWVLQERIDEQGFLYKREWRYIDEYFDFKDGKWYKLKKGDWK